MVARSPERKLTIEKLGERELVMTRAFAAPRLAVFEAWTTPEQLKQWFGPPDWSLPICEIDLRVGGAWRFVMKKAPHGTMMELKGEYREIVPGERLVFTESFEPSWYEGEALSTITLVENAGLTTMKNVILYGSRAIRDAVLESNADTGVAASYERLEHLLRQGEA